MKCLECNKIFPNIGEMSNHMKSNHGISGKRDFNCLQCELPFEELHVFRDHLRTCKRRCLNDLRTESAEDFEMCFETTNVETAETPAADGLTDESDQPIHISESGNSEEFELFFETADVETAGDESAADGLSGESDQLKLKSVLASWGVTPLYENLIACGISSQNMCYLDNRDLYIVIGNDKHLLGDMVKFRHLLRQYSTDSASKESDTLKKKSTFVNVLSILHQSDEGKAFISKYRNLKLNVDLRSQLVGIILKETFSRGMLLPRPCLDNMAIQICKIFTKEKKCIYYHKLPKQHPTGILYTKYINLRHAQLKSERQASINVINNECETVQVVEEEEDIRNDLQCDAISDTSNELEIFEVVEEEEEIRNKLQSDAINDTSNELETVVEEEEDISNGLQSDAIHIDDQCSSDNIESSLKFIKDYTQGCNKKFLLEHWKKTFKHRQEKIKEYKDIDEAFDDWPPLKTKTGYALLCMDFVMEYGVDISNGLNNWNSFFEKNLAGITQIIKDPLVRRQLNGLISSINHETKNKTIIMALHHLLVPSGKVINKEHWKPTIQMSQKSFMKVVNGEHVMRSDMTKRNKFCKAYGMKNHPVIFEITTCMGTRYNVCIKDVTYEVGSLLEGVDVAYKMFKILDIEFPFECTKVWKFIEHIFYVEDDNISGNFLSIISDMNNE